MVDTAEKRRKNEETETGHFMAIAFRDTVTPFRDTVTT